MLIFPFSSVVIQLKIDNYTHVCNLLQISQRILQWFYEKNISVGNEACRFKFTMYIE